MKIINLLIFSFFSLLVSAFSQSPGSSLLPVSTDYTSVITEALNNNIVIEDDVNGTANLPNSIFIKFNKDVPIYEVTNKALYLCEQVGLMPKIVQAMSDGSMSQFYADKKNNSLLSNNRINSIQLAENNLSRLVKVYYSNDTPPLVAAKKIKENSIVQYSEPVFVYKVLSQPNDPNLTEQKGSLDNIKAIQGWEVFKGDSNIIIGIVDAAVDMFHEDLAPNIALNQGENGTDSKGRSKKTNGIDDDNNGVIDDFYGANFTAQMDTTVNGNTKGQNHGTVVAGLAAARTNNAIGVAGLGYNSKFVPVKTSRKEGGFILFGYEGITYCARRGCKIINCSWGGPGYSEALQDIITSVVDGYDVALMCAGGNDVKYGTIYPAAYNNVAGVGAIDLENKLTTTWGEHIDFSSVAGYSTSNDNKYEVAGAYTSYATPVASGLMALVRGKYQKLSAEQAIMHVRETTDDIDSYNKGKEKYVGLGKINVLRALSEDPFSKPGLVIDSIRTTDDNGKPKEKFSVGDKGRIYFRIRNILGSANSVRVSPKTYIEGDDKVISFTSSDVYIPLINQGEIVNVLTPIEFEIKKDDTNETKLRFDISANNGAFKDYFYKKLFLFAITTDYLTPRFKLSIANNGGIGFADFPNNQIGLGIELNDIQQLYEGGFIMATDSLHILNNVRVSQSSQQKSNFILEEKPTLKNDSTLTFSDAISDSTSRIGLICKLKVKKDISEPNAFGLELITKNASNKTIKNLKSALFLDWDLNNSGDNQNIKQIYNNLSNIPIYGILDDGNGTVVAQGIAGKVPSPIFYPMNNETDINIYDDFSNLEKWKAISNSINKKEVLNADISFVLGKEILSLEPLENDTTLFVFGFGSTVLKAENSLKKLISLRTISVEEDTKHFTMNLKQNLDNIIISLNEKSQNSTLIVFDVLGKKIIDLNNQLADNIFNNQIVFNTTSLPKGKYFVRYTSDKIIQTKMFVIEN